MKNWKVTFRQKIENIAIKGEIARFEQFQLLLQCFQKSSVIAGVKCRQCEVMDYGINPFRHCKRQHFLIAADMVFQLQSVLN